MILGKGTEEERSLKMSYRLLTSDERDRIIQKLQARECRLYARLESIDPIREEKIRELEEAIDYVQEQMAVIKPY
jgi:hypothetical protein